ncbi:MAG TPA: alpha amylase C-terminal domain-containing protein [Candidatus Acidoferrales bacterium]|nr:alpha amylase C-terminal domain-containing protein [Candidatus Acidoferrales bacterium]
MSAPSPVLTYPVDLSTPLGATVVPGGVTLRTWAPAAKQVFVLSGNLLSAARQPGFTPPASGALAPLGDGSWGAFLPGAGEGTSYIFWIVGTGSTGLKRDPRARELTANYPNSDCLARSPFTYRWHDEAFRAPEFRDLILYQLHIGTFYAVDSQGHDRRLRIAKFLDILDRVDYLRDLGINGIQVLPIQEFPGESSEGYNGLDLFSPEMLYQVSDADLAPYVAKANALLSARGKPPLTAEQLRPGPNQLKCVIDILHLNGISVLFDLVFNHAGGGWDDACLRFFDRQPENDMNRSLYFTDQGWVGGLVFAYWNQDVRQFLIDNALSCLEEYHIDGIRYDEVTVIDNHGGGRFCQDLSSTVRFVKPQAIQIAEYWGNDRAAAVRPSPAGLGFDAAWGDLLRDGVRAAIAQAAGGRDAFVDFAQLAASLTTPAGFGSAWQVVNCLENHDIVFDGHGQRVPALAGGLKAGPRFAPSRARVAAGLLFAARGIPMLFMGQEFLEEKQWDDNVQLHPDLLIGWDQLAGDRVMQDYLKFIRDLLRLRRSQPALRGESLRVSRAHSIDRVIAIHRWIEGQGDDVLLAANLQEFNRFSYRIGFPGSGAWREIFNSDYYEQFPNPSVVGNNGGIAAENVPWDGMPASAEITIPANGFVVFCR